MSDPNWTSPSGPVDPLASAAPPDSSPADPQAGQQQYVYAAIDPNQNWGVAVPRIAGYSILVPRPPRPAIVELATTLAFVGVGIALALQITNAIYQWTHRAEIFAAVSGDEQMPPEFRNATDTGATIGLFIGLTICLVVAAGVVVCTVLTVKKKNAARIVLAAAMGVLGLYQLCQVGSGAIVLAAGEAISNSSPNSPFNASFASAQVTWWLMTGQALLAVIALIVFVSLIVPPANRYFAPSPGHRFAPEV